MQIINVFLCRSSVRSVFSTGVFNSRLIASGAALEIVLALMINYTPLGNWLLDTAPIPPQLWLALVAFAGVMLVLEEVRKWIVRRTLRRNSFARST